MKLIKKIFLGYGQKALKEHPASIVACIMASVLGCILSECFDYDSDSAGMVYKFFSFITGLSSKLVLSFAFSESVYYFMKNRDENHSLKDIKKSYPFFIVLLLSITVAFIGAIRHLYFPWDQEGIWIDELWDILTMIMLFGTVFFLYLKSRDTFERYIARACWSIARAIFLCLIILIGCWCVALVYSSLFCHLVDLSEEKYLIWGFIGYPTILMGFSKPKEKPNTFEIAITSYVAPFLLAIGMIIAYAYIGKIVITWRFPSNETFRVMSAIIVAGIFIWTIGQGFAEGKQKKILDIMPLFCVPFIVMQIICLSMRISAYGITEQRYKGIILVVFEIVYLFLCVFFLIKKKNCGKILLPLIIVTLLIAYHAPYINVFETAYRSQKQVIDNYLTMEDHGGVTIKQAQSSYRELEYHAGRLGKEYVKNIEINNDEVIVKALDEYGGYTYTNDGDHLDRSIIGWSHPTEINVFGYSMEYLVNTKYEVEDEFDLHSIELWEGYYSYSSGTPSVCTLDLDEFVNGYTSIYDNGTEDEQDEYMAQPIYFDDGSVFYCTKLFYGVTEDGKVISIEVEGRYLTK